MYHYVLLSLVVVLLVLLAVILWNGGKSLVEMAYYVVLTAVVCITVAYLRLYALKLQNRIIKEELRLRYFMLTGKSFAVKEAALRSGQVFALRFASDEELPALVEAAIAEQLRPIDIKKRIKAWRGDYDRV
jgi:hypothetical protein